MSFAESMIFRRKTLSLWRSQNQGSGSNAEDGGLVEIPVDFFVSARPHAGGQDAAAQWSTTGAGCRYQPSVPRHASESADERALSDAWYHERDACIRKLVDVTH